MNLADVAPRLARARDERVQQLVERQARKEARIAEARERKRARREAAVTSFCGKVRYLTCEDAKAGRSKARAHVRLRVYECLACGGWHLTSKAHPRWAKAGESEAA